MRPYLSVVVINHNRTEFITQALDSIYSQNFDQELFEIIVVSNVKIEFSDAAEQLEVIYSNHEGYGEKVVNAIERSKGEIIVLLDDDDSFNQEKLRVIYDEFMKDNSLGYFHNSYELMDFSGNIIDKKFRVFDTQNSFEEFYFPNCKDKALFAAINRGIDFNHSCISFRKSIVTDRLNFLRSITGSYDTLLFFLCLASNLKAKMSDLKLTRYRLHGSSSSQEAGKYEYIARWTEKRLRNYYKIADMLKKVDNKSLTSAILYKILDAQLILDIAKFPGRRIVLFHAFTFLIMSKNLGKYELEKLLLSILNLFSNNIARYLYIARK